MTANTITANTLSSAYVSASLASLNALTVSKATANSMVVKDSINSPVANLSRLNAISGSMNSLIVSDTLSVKKITIIQDPAPIKDITLKYDPVNNPAIKPFIAILTKKDLRYVSPGNRQSIPFFSFNEARLDTQYKLISFDVTVIDKYGTIYKPELITEGQQYHPFERLEVYRSGDVYYLYIHVGYMAQPVSLQEKFSNCKIIVKFDMALIDETTLN